MKCPTFVQLAHAAAVESGMTSTAARLILVLALVGALTSSPGALAAPPDNDRHTSPQDLGGLPASASGTTAEATLDRTAERDDEPPSCRAIKGSVWYRIRPGAKGEMVGVLDAAGDMDAVVDVFERTRSQLTPVGCGTTDPQGIATVEVDLAKDAEYLVRVAALNNSTQDSFKLRLLRPDAPESPPGRQLPPRGVAGAVDRLTNPDDAFAVSLHAGTTYRLNLVSAGGGCVAAEMFSPGSVTFARAAVVRRLRCDHYALFTPRGGEGGRYSIRVRAVRGQRIGQQYRVQVATAGVDDTAPGIFMRNDTRVYGVLHGEAIDAIDLYRFDVTRRSDLHLGLQVRGARPIDLELRNDRGRVIECRCYEEGTGTIDTRVKPGRYFVAVRARETTAARYQLFRLSRSITSAKVLIGGRRSAKLRPGEPMRIKTLVRPAVNGRVTLTIERFDPIAGWQFVTTAKPSVDRGVASYAFTPPTVGRWRVRALYNGTRTASPSDGGFARALVSDPLHQ